MINDTEQEAVKTVPYVPSGHTISLDPDGSMARLEARVLTIAERLRVESKPDSARAILAFHGSDDGWYELVDLLEAVVARIERLEGKEHA